jgi:hypothetical protein
MGKILLVLLCAVVLVACRQEQQPQPAATTTPGLQKIKITDPQTVERVRQAGLQILVQQPDYLIVRPDSANAGKIQTLAAESQPATEQDLVQRLVRIHFSEQPRLQQIVGVDVWEVETDSVTARVYDLHLEKLRQDGFPYRILKMNASAPDSVGE